MSTTHAVRPPPVTVTIVAGGGPAVLACFVLLGLLPLLPVLLLLKLPNPNSPRLPDVLLAELSSWAAVWTAACCCWLLVLGDVEGSVAGGRASGAVEMRVMSFSQDAGTHPRLTSTAPFLWCECSTQGGSMQECDSFLIYCMRKLIHSVCQILYGSESMMRRPP
jgi:hypothetical protein